MTFSQRDLLEAMPEERGVSPRASGRGRGDAREAAPRVRQAALGRAGLRAAVPRAGDGVAMDREPWLCRRG